MQSQPLTELPRDLEERIVRSVGARALERPPDARLVVIEAAALEGTMLWASVLSIHEGGALRHYIDEVSLHREHVSIPRSYRDALVRLGISCAALVVAAACIMFGPR